ncbi:ATP-binding Cassette (ABC) Superfamily [Phytophthora infestans T30-4]|uniref:ATP-binding Cassette (ABC) Superfamily n=1 Tax=Phytophthora infestans (strain T30-4) TaxID=403677 RepID=D0NJM5_PHYIT|nr:ATP-binding Cassette (ABC) Superfamily [Phytophthora infestans T30-4]EEY59961.1 ATP-binding Cassette (ABC) Superfamily [Phytophthora infestans T30-4]|eukprot:XP_002900646.1 ATP-binding Cassette (ABC) Superfamily [Phytophthora infestans T30-4]
MGEEIFPAEDNSSVGDVVPDTLTTAKASNYRLPRFNSRRVGSSDQDPLPRTKSMYPDPQELTKDDLTSADTLMADGVFTMNSTLSSVIEKALGHPIPGLEVRFHNLELSALVPQFKSGGLEVPTLWTQVQQGVTSLCAPKENNLTVEKKILRGISGVFKPGRITLILGLEPWVVEALENCTPEQREHALEVMTAHHEFAPDITVKKLGLDNCKDTVVGNAMLRGVSGGERKRVTTGEMTVAWKRLQLLDEISTGLDSAATYDICKSMKSAARNFNSTVVISLLQPSPEVFELFDDVLLLNEGSIMFHGKREDAVPYFERMGFHCPPRKDVADFLLDLGTNKQDVYVTEDTRSVPYHAADFAKVFMDSDIFQKTLKRLDASADAMVFADLKPFHQTYTEELVTLLQRQAMLTLRDTTYLMGRAVMVIVMGLLYGSTFWQMNDTDSQLMLGLLFSCAMFLSMSQASQVATYMDARSVFYKHRGVNFFPPKYDVCVYKGTDYCAEYSQTVGKYTLSVFNLQTESAWIWYGWIFLVAGYFISVFCSYLVLEYMRFESPENVALAQSDDADNDQTAYSKMPATPKEYENVVDIVDNGVTTQAFANNNVVPVTLAFHDLWYSVPLPGGANDEQIDLLKGVSGFALPGTMTALMGSSGAGKTTLMDVIAGRKTGGKIQGKILLNGHPANDLAIRRCTGYCEQMDIHSDSATVREALIFSAMLRQDASISTEQKMESVQECIDLLELGPIADKIIRGSSTEQMKRVTIGVELTAQPSIIFMDEPTSGLDARSAKLIMNGVRKIADSGRTIVCTIHQPSTEVFNFFDSLLLLRRGGRMVFFGELGEESKNLINYFEAFNDVKPITPGYNPATWMLECIGAGVGGGKAAANADPSQPKDFAERFMVSDQKELMEEDLDQEGVLYPSPHLPELKFDTKRASSSATQFNLLCRRFFRMYWRTPAYNLTRLIISLVLACVFAIIYQGTDYTTYTGANAGVGLVFVSTLFLGIIGFNNVMPVAAEERTAFYREPASETYNALWYFIAGTLMEIPYIFVASLVFCAIFFPSVGFTGYMTFVYYWLVISLNTLVFVYLGQLMVFALPSVAVAATLGSLFSGIFLLFAGYNPPASSIPTGYKWVHYISPPTYTIAILVALVFADCPVGSTDGISCQKLSNSPPSVGNVTLKEYVEDNFDMNHDNIWRNVMILLILIVAFRVLALFSLRYINHLKR